MSAPVALVGVSDAVPCPAWCIGRNDLEGEHVHSGAYTDVSPSVGCWVWQDAEKVGIYVADGDMTPAEARQLVAGLLGAADLAGRIGSGRRLHAARSAAGLTVQQLAKLAGLAPACVEGIESGDRQASDADLMALAWSLDVDDAELRGVGEA